MKTNRAVIAGIVAGVSLAIAALSYAQPFGGMGPGFGGGMGMGPGHGPMAGVDPATNVVDVHIRALRDKIDRPFRVTSVETVRGAGYRLRRDGGRPTPHSVGRGQASR